MRKQMQKQATTLIIVFAFALIICGAASAAAPTGQSQSGAPVGAQIHAPGDPSGSGTSNGAVARTSSGTFQTKGGTSNGAVDRSETTF
jgi:hypothetical protein